MAVSGSPFYLTTRKPPLIFLYHVSPCAEQSTADRVKYSDAELEARRQKIGLWRDPNPIPPWDYRQAERERRKSLEPFVGKSTVRGAQ